MKARKTFSLLPTENRLKMTYRRQLKHTRRLRLSKNTSEKQNFEQFFLHSETKKLLSEDAVRSRLLRLKNFLSENSARVAISRSFLITFPLFALPIERQRHFNDILFASGSFSGFSANRGEGKKCE